MNKSYITYGLITIFVVYILAYIMGIGFSVLNIYNSENVIYSSVLLIGVLIVICTVIIVNKLNEIKQAIDENHR